MSVFIVFRLYGPLAAWGDIAVGEARPTTMHPSKSAVLGLLAAALGIRRHEDERHRALRDGYAFAVRVDAVGVPLRDFHTSQEPRRVTRLAHLRTRRDELSDRDNRYTNLSARDYRCDTLSTVCLCQRGQGEYQGLRPQAVVAALARPRLPLYLGRKSCPLALPLAARVIEVETMEEALVAFDEGEQGTGSGDLLDRLGVLRLPAAADHYWEEGVPTRLSALHSVPRYDQPISRTRRQFASRTEHYRREN